MARTGIRTRRLTPALVATMAAALAACSSGGGIASSDRASELPKDEKDRQIVQAGLLKLIDFPAGWAIDTDAEQPDPELDRIEEQIPECQRVTGINESVTLGKAESSDFVNTTDAQASNDVELYADAAKVDEMQALQVSPDALSCLQQGLRTALNFELAKDADAAAVVRDVSVTGGQTPVPQYGDGAVGVSFVATVDAGAAGLNFYFEGVSVKVGRAQASFLFMDDLLDPAADIQSRVIEASVNRLRAAGA
jgi:hypothetical protein